MQKPIFIISEACCQQQQRPKFPTVHMKLRIVKKNCGHIKTVIWGGGGSIYTRYLYVRNMNGSSLNAKSPA